MASSVSNLATDQHWIYAYGSVYMYLQAISSVIKVFESVVGGSPSGDVQHSDSQLVQCFIGQP